MAGLGDTNLGKRNPVSKFLSTSSSKDRKFTVTKGVIFSKEQDEQFELVKLVIGKDTDAATLRYVFDVFWKDHGEEITEKAEKIKKIIS